MQGKEDKLERAIKENAGIAEQLDTNRANAERSRLMTKQREMARTTKRVLHKRDPGKKTKAKEREKVHGEKRLCGFNRLSDS